MPEVDQTAPVLDADFVERTPVEDTGSLADHEASFTGKRGASPPAPEKTEAVEPADDEADGRDETTGQFKPRHRASRDKARAEDVPEIQALSRTLKEKREALAKLNPAMASASPRVASLRLQIRGIEAELEAASPKRESAPVAAAPSRPAAHASAFTEAEPTLEQFANEADPYAAWQRALARYDRRKDAFEEQQQQAQQTQAQREQAQRERIGQQAAAFAAKTPDYVSSLEAIKHETAPDLLMAAIGASDNGAELVYYLAKHPVDRHEMYLITDGKPVSDQAIASVRRLLDARMQAGLTGAVATPVVPKTKPKPPTPVRTGPLTTGDEPPGDGASLADHERAYSKSRRR